MINLRDTAFFMEECEIMPKKKKKDASFSMVHEH